ncbi:MAG: hypothetical protein HW416_2446 [Chloroflexi bacterium]|nr:hypothetical protein [Chloroflexota bacterium]
MAWDDVVEVAVATNDLGLTARYLPGETQALREDYYLRSHGSRRNRVQGPAEFPPVFGGLTSNALTVNDRYQGASVLNGTWSGPTSDVRHVWLDRQVDRVHAREGAG